jgi:hypothetical protein
MLLTLNLVAKGVTLTSSRFNFEYHNTSRMTSIGEAIASASSSDIISFQHQGQDVCLVATLDEVNGGLKWDNDSTPGAAINRHLRTKKWISPMLNDEPRNSFYKTAITKALSSTR